MTPSASPPRPPITDSPWFWVYLYAVAGLIALALMEPRFGTRQAEIERQYQGRQRAVERNLGDEPTTTMSTRENTIITLRPLYLVLAAIFAIAWIALWWRHFHQRPKSIESETVKDASFSRPEDSP